MPLAYLSSSTSPAAGNANRPHEPGRMAQVAGVGIDSTRLNSSVRVRTRDAPSGNKRAAFMSSSILQVTEHPHPEAWEACELAALRAARGNAARNLGAMPRR